MILRPHLALGPFLPAAALVLALGVGCSSQPRNVSADFFVSPSGDDSNPGTFGKPFATPRRATEAVRLQRASQPGRPVVVLFRGGLYRLGETWVLSEKDSGEAGAPVTYASYPGESPVLVGDRPLPGTPELQDGRWSLKWDPKDSPGGALPGQLFVNGKPGLVSREPDEKFAVYGKGSEEAETGLILELPENLRASAASPGFVEGGARLTVLNKWDFVRRPVADVRSGATEILAKGAKLPAWWQLGKDTLFQLENFREAVDTPGEYWIGPRGRSHELLYFPQPGRSDVAPVFTVAALPVLLNLKGQPGAPVSHVVIKGLGFSRSSGAVIREKAQSASDAGAAVELTSAREVKLEGIRVSDTANYGVFFRENCQRCALTASDLTDLGAGGVRIGETRMPSPANLNSHITVSENRITHLGKNYWSGAGVLLTHAADCVISHNEIADTHYTAVSAGWVWGYDDSPSKRNQIVNNHMHHIGQGVLGDLGGVYTLGKSEGTTVARNHIHHVRARGYGGWGLYTDEGSTEVVMEDNLVHDTQHGGFHQHYGRDNVIRRNFFINNGPNHEVQGTRIEAHRSLLFRDNVIVGTSPRLFGSNWSRMKIESSHNVWWNPEKPAQAAAQLAAARTAGQETGSQAVDPGLDPVTFRPRPESPLIALKLAPLDPAQAGLSDPIRRAAAAREPMPSGKDPRLP